MCVCLIACERVRLCVVVLYEAVVGVHNSTGLSSSLCIVFMERKG